MLVVAASDVVLAVVTFTLLARPDAALVLAARLGGLGAAWDQGVLSDAVELALVELHLS